MSFSSWFWGTTQLEDAIQKATSELLPSGSEDIALNLEICDQIRSKSAPAKDAMRAIKGRLNHKNPNVQLLTLGLTDICVKNGGDHFLTEIASREFMDNLVSILKVPTLNLDVKNMILRLVQNWAVAFEGKPSLSYVSQVYKTLTNEGFKFPPKDLTAASSAMVDTQTAPEWIDSDVCLRCRTAFTFTNRKHHCRNCGQVFDQQCSSKTMALPHFGITQEVRVCDSCYAKLGKNRDRADKKGHRHSTSLHGTRSRSARDLADADLQRAIQLSLQEVNGPHPRGGYVPSQPSPAAWQYSEPPLVDRSTHPTAQSSEDDDPDLKAAIEASLREANAPKPSAPIALETPRSETTPTPTYSQSYPPTVAQPPQPKLPNYDLEPLESDAILTFTQTVEQVQAQGGKDISKYPAVSELYDKASSLRPKLAMSLDDTGRKEKMLTEMHEKLSDIVKLYDSLLSKQLSQPRRQSYQQAPQFQQQQPNGYHVNGWVPPHQTSPSYQQPPVEAPQQQHQQHQSYFSPQLQYAPQQPQPQEAQYGQIAQQTTGSSTSTSQQPYSYPQQAYAESQQYTSPTPGPQQPQQYISAAPSQQQPQQYSSPTILPSQPQQYGLPSQQHASHSEPQPYTPPSQTLAQPPHVYGSPPIVEAHHQQQSPPLLPNTTSIPSVQSPPPVSYGHAPPQQSSVPLAPAQSPPLANYTSSSGFSRQNTVSYAPTHAPSRSQSHLARSNTVAARPQQAQAQLPQFPIAPTSTPQAFEQMYAAPSGIPSGVAQQEERKEALLIDL